MTLRYPFLLAGALLFSWSLQGFAVPRDDIKALAGSVGRVLGAASACPQISNTRIKAVSDRVTAAIQSSGDRADANEALAVFNASYFDGVRDANTKKTDCSRANRELSDLENVVTPMPQENAAGLVAKPGVFATQIATGPVQGVSETEIKFGASLPLSGPNKDYGNQTRTGIETAFRQANEAGGVHGRMLRFIVADDGYEPTRTAETMKQLHDKEQVFGFVGNFGSATAAVALPFALERRSLFYGAYSGADFLRRDPPDRYVFNYRPSCSEEAEAAVHYLVGMRGLKPEQIAFFGQQDAFGDAGFAGAAKAIRALRGGESGAILRTGYPRNTLDVDPAVAHIKASKTPIKAVVMGATYRAAAKFIEKSRAVMPDLIYVNPSAVDSSSLRDELMLLGPRYTKNVIVTQVTPSIDGYSSLILEYKSALAKYFDGEAPDYVSFEYYIAGRILIEALKKAGPQLDSERLVDTLESMGNLDIGLGTPIRFSRSDHQGLHKVWGTQLNASGHYEAIELQ